MNSRTSLLTNSGGAVSAFPRDHMTLPKRHDLFQLQPVLSHLSLIHSSKLGLFQISSLLLTH